MDLHQARDVWADVGLVGAVKKLDASAEQIAANREIYDRQREALVAAARAFRDEVPDVSQY